MLRRISQGTDGPAGGLVCVGKHQGDEGPVTAVQPLDAPQAVAEVGSGQRRSLPNEADGAAPGQGEQHVVGTAAVVVHAHGVALRVGVGDHGGDAVEHGYGIQTLGQQPEPLARHRILADEALGTVLNPPSDHDALLRGEVPALWSSAQRAQMVRHGAHEAPRGQLL